MLGGVNAKDLELLSQPPEQHDITVEKAEKQTRERAAPSVFSRLGPGAPEVNYFVLPSVLLFLCSRASVCDVASHLLHCRTKVFHLRLSLAVRLCSYTRIYAQIRSTAYFCVFHLSVQAVWPR